MEEDTIPTHHSRRRTIKKAVLAFVAVAILAGATASYRLTRDGDLVTPTGDGTVALDAGTFEESPLPDYAASFVDDDYLSYFIEVEPGIKVHILEVGSGYPVYLQHGAPTSGFLYRQVAAQLPRDQFRLIMPTMVGLGFSSKVPASEHTIDNHLRWMNSALEQLELEELVYVGHDWGGPVGMGTLERSPELLQGAVILNTVLAAPDEISLAAPLRLAKTPVIGEIVLEGVVSIFDQLPGFQANPDSFPQDVVDLYSRPVNESGNAKGPLAILRMSADNLDHPTAQQARVTEEYILGLDVPVEIVWGMNDSILGDRLDEMTPLFPDARITETSAGHFLQEEADGPEAIAEAITRIVEEVR